jgi:hypothetical protein
MLRVELLPGLSQKPGVHIENLVPELTQVFPKILEVFQEHHAPDPMITSGNDSLAHARNSFHYRNRAIDLRGNNLSRWKLQQLAQNLQERLGKIFRVHAEIFPRSPARNHIHIEYTGN